VPVEPFTPVGQIAARYNRVIASLDQALARTDAIVASAIETIVTVTAKDLVIRSVNPAVRKMFGLSERQLAGSPLTTLLQTEIPTPQPVAVGGTSRGLEPISGLSRLLQTASLTGTPYELKGQRRSGGQFPVEVTVAFLPDRQEDCYTLIIRDITLRKQAETAIQLAEAKDIEARHLEKTLRELQEAQLQLVHSEKMSSLGQLVAGVAHEINNPVNFIAGNLTYVDEYVGELLELIEVYRTTSHDSDSEAIRRKLKQIDLDYLTQDLPKILGSMRGGTDRIIEIVRSLKEFSHAGRAQLKAVDLHQGLESTLVILGSKLKSKGPRPDIQVLRDYGNLPKVECYPGQLNQVFMNLLTNAIDAIDEKWEAQVTPEAIPSSTYQPQITVRTEIADDDHIHLYFTDNGIGIPEAVQRRIHDPFFTTKPVGKGTGLGMSISYQIVVGHHQGEINCISTPGRGTQFLVKIPREQSSLSAK
jgi:Amt family ammonium transporter